MRNKINRRAAARIALALGALAATAALISAPKSPFTKKDKAYYADPNLVNYVRPGLVVKIQSANIASDGTITATVKFTDPKGVPLDISGVDTPGVIRSGNPSMVAAFIPKGQVQYTAYTTRVQTSPITGRSATQAGADSGGRWVKVSDGVYTYTFGTKAPSGWDKSATHAVGCYANRDLTEFGFGVNLDDDVYVWVPDGSAKPVTREVIKTQSCQKCHVDTFAFHGTGGRVSVPMCTLCHTPQTVDPDTGNTVDLPAMIHSIHMGADLPKKPYIIIGNAQSVNDFSAVAIPTDKRNCTVCHEQMTGAAQAKNYLTRPTRAACGSCHNDVNFATGENHVNLPQPNDNACAQCHIPQGELEYDASILGAHTINNQSNQLDGIKWAITKVDNGTAGKKPMVTFTLANKAGKPIAPSDFGRLNVVLGGPTTDYTTIFPGVSTPGYVSENALTAATGSNGTYAYTFTNAIPASAKGTFSVSLEGRRVQTLNPGTTRQIANVQYGGPNPVFYFSVDGSKAMPRRQIVNIAKCQACHVSLRLHGENRVDNTDHCVVCHNPVESDVARRPASAGAAQSIDFRQMIHNVHGGEQIRPDASEDYIIYGFGGSTNNFSDVTYPGRLATCSACHVGNSYTLPRPDYEAQVSNPRGHLNPSGPEAAACLACHKSIEAASHALGNTTRLGEACAVCHGEQADFAVSKVHATQ